MGQIKLGSTSSYNTSKSNGEETNFSVLTQLAIVHKIIVRKNEWRDLITKKKEKRKPRNSMDFYELLGVCRVYSMFLTFQF